MGTQGKSALFFSSIRILTPIKTVLSIQEALIIPYIAFFQNDVIKEPQRLVPKDSINIEGYIYIKIKIRATLDKRDFTIY
jgi:hypothetical protein